MITYLLQLTAGTILRVAVECLLVGVEPVAPACQAVEVALLVAFVFGPVPSTPCGDDFKKIYEAENILFLKELNQQR